MHIFENRPVLADVHPNKSDGWFAPWSRARCFYVLALHHLRATGSMKDMAITTASGQLSDGTLRKSSDAAALFGRLAGAPLGGGEQQPSLAPAGAAGPHAGLIS